MTTFPLRASDLPNVQNARPVFGRVAAVFVSMAEVIAEAARLVDGAHKRLSWH